MYNEFSPSRPLMSYVDKYWEFKGSPGAGRQIHILPDGCTDFIFTLGEVAGVTNRHSALQPYRSYFVGPMTTYSQLAASTDSLHMVGIRFRPGGLFRFLRLPLAQLTDARIATAELDCFLNDSLADRLVEKKDMQSCICLLDTVLIKRLMAYERTAEQKIRFVIDRIDQSHGGLPVGNLAGLVDLSSRQLERQFKEITGFTPKAYSRIIRFRHAVDLLRRLPFDNLLSTAVEAGYYDVPHLCREIRKMSGISPLSFLSVPQSKELTLTYIES